MFWFFRISGRSLYPTYQDGDFVLVSKIPIFFRRLRQGDVVVLRHPSYGTLIKRVDRLKPDRDEIYLAGTQEDSLDSRQFGPVRQKRILGKMIWHIRKPALP
jgi:nickel-type superoxide dismutase maturation protease